MGNLFSWGDKGGGGGQMPPAIPQQQPHDNTGAMMEMMMGMMEASSSAMSHAASQPPQLPAMPAIPTAAKPLLIDWTDKQAQLAAKAKADYGVNSARRKGATDTVKTGSLLDEEDADVTDTLLSSGDET